MISVTLSKESGCLQKVAPEGRLDCVNKVMKVIPVLLSVFLIIY